MSSYELRVVNGNIQGVFASRDLKNGESFNYRESNLYPHYYINDAIELILPDQLLEPVQRVFSLSDHRIDMLFKEYEVKSLTLSNCIFKEDHFQITRDVWKGEELLTHLGVSFWLFDMLQHSDDCLHRLWLLIKGNFVNLDTQCPRRILNCAGFDDQYLEVHGIASLTPDQQLFHVLNVLS